MIRTVVCSMAVVLVLKTASVHGERRRETEPASPQGLARPGQYVVLSPAEDGVLSRVLVTEGQLVKQGQVLAVLDHRIASASVEVARSAASRSADIEFARHDLRLAESYLRRIAAVRKELATTEFEYEEAGAKRDKARASLDAALERKNEAGRQLELAQARLEMHFIRAPFDGQVVRIDAVPGKMLLAHDELVTLADASQLRAELHLPVELFGQLTAGKEYQLQAIEPINGPLSAHLTFVSPLVDAGSRTFRCVFIIDNRSRQLPAGFGLAYAPQKQKQSAAAESLP